MGGGGAWYNAKLMIMQINLPCFVRLEIEQKKANIIYVRFVLYFSVQDELF